MTGSFKPLGVNLVVLSVLLQLEKRSIDILPVRARSRESDPILLFGKEPANPALPRSVAKLDQLRGSQLSARHSGMP